MTLTVSHLTFAYPKAPPVLEDVSFTVPAGDFLSVLGANGAGKSTLFRCLLGGLFGIAITGNVGVQLGAVIATVVVGLVLGRVCGAILGLFGTKNDTYQDEDDFILE